MPLSNGTPKAIKNIDIDWTRRGAYDNFARGILCSIAASGIIVHPSIAATSDKIGSFEHPVAIIGGGGRTGMAVAEYLTGESGQMYAVTMTRSGKDPFRIIKLPSTNKDRLRHYDDIVDVTVKDSLHTAFQEIKPSVVVYAASASKQGGNSFDVDDRGVKNVAIECKNIGAKLILISALALDRPESKSFQITNTLGGYLDKIMEAKLNGEENARSIMGSEYIIIRPGVLLSGKSKNGANDIELNQGDTIGGGLSRDELSGIVVGAIQNGKYGITVEVYRKVTATKLQPEFSIPSGNELYASSFEGLFKNTIKD